MSPQLDRSRLQSLLEAFPRLRIGVLGDFTLDGYWYADMTRAQLSRETPLFPRPVVRETYSPGGAANVAWNLAELGVGQVWAFSVFGSDWRGQILHGLLVDLGIKVEDLIISEQWKTPFFGKVVLSGYQSQQEDARLDFINTALLPAEVENRLLEAVTRRLTDLDALVIADYQEFGVVTPRLTATLGERARRGVAPLFIADSRTRLAQFPTMIIKPNEVEAAALFFPDRPFSSLSREDFASAALRRAEASGLPVFITLGSQGCLVCSPPQAIHLPAVPVPPPIDTVGAGDTFLAALAAALAAHASPVEAASLGCLAAAISIRKLGVTGTASPKELLELHASL